MKRMVKMRNGNIDFAGIAMWVAIATVLSVMYWSVSSNERAKAQVDIEAAKSGLEQCEYKDSMDRVKLKWQKQCKDSR